MNSLYKKSRTISIFWTKLIGFGCFALIIQIQFLVASDWQKKYDYKQLRENFQQPPLWYAPHTFWFWDAPLNAKLTAAMAKEMAKQRLNPGYAHARHSGAPGKSYPSLPVEQWLSPEWFKSFSAALKEAEQAGMTLGYCDEYWWPSGQAAGRVLEQNPELMAQSLKWDRQVLQGPASIKMPASKFTVAGRLSNNNLLLVNTLQMIGEGETFTWTVPQGKWMVYSYSIYFHPGVDGGKVNYLNPKLMDVFMSIAHQPYEQHFKDHLGKSLPGVFVDNEGDYGWKMAWSEYLAERFMEMKKRDIRLWLPLLTEEDEAGIWAKARYDWFDVVSDVYTKQFLGRLSDWLEERGMYCISNLWEESLMLQTRAVGDFMRAQRAVSMPGNDCLQKKSQHVHDFKETQSVCEFEDRPFMSELMGVAGWEQTPVQMKQTLNAVTAWGITHTVPHGINLNRKLETIPYPADWFTENPYWRYLHLWTDFARRAAFVNRQGHLVADILLFNPLESVWALSRGYFTSEDGIVRSEKVIEINSVYSAAMNTLSDAWLDYLIADSYYLNKMIVKKVTKSNQVSLNFGNYNFSVLVLPPMFILPQPVAQKILEFAKEGGIVILLGELPQGSPETGANDPLIAKQMHQLASLPTVINLADKQDKIEKLPGRISSALQNQVEILSGDLPLLISHRKIGMNHLYWLANNTPNQQKCKLAFRDGSGRAEIWNCETGDINSVYYETMDKRKKLDLEFKPYEAFWLVFDAEKTPVIAEKLEPAKIKEIKLPELWEVSFPETKTIQVTSARTLITSDTISQAEFLKENFNDSNWDWINMVGRIKLVDSWRASMLYNPQPESQRFYRYTFHLENKPNASFVNINADNSVKFWVNGTPVKPGNHSSSWANSDVHDIGSLLQKDKNVIAVEVTNLYGYGWLLFQGKVKLTNGDIVELMSKPSWKETTKTFAGWLDINYDDSAWQDAVLAQEDVRKKDLRTTRKPHKILFSKNAVWWRIKIPPTSKEVYLPGLSDEAKIWINGKMEAIIKNKVILPKGAKNLVIKNICGDIGLSGPAEFYCNGPQEQQLGSWLDFGLKRFTGFVDYETKINIPNNVSSLTLELGKVLHMAEVWVNDKKVGERLWPPFTFNTNAIKRGENKVRIRIGNLMVNEMGLKDDLGELRHWGWQGAPADSCFDAGLFGPVRLFIKN
jgi:hypothetical protein